MLVPPISLQSTPLVNTAGIAEHGSDKILPKVFEQRLGDMLQKIETAKPTGPSEDTGPSLADRISSLSRFMDDLIWRAENTSLGQLIDPGHLRSGKAHLIEDLKFEQEHGFARQTTSAAKSVYDAAQSGRINPRHFNSQSDAIEYAKSSLSTFSHYISTINSRGQGDPSVEGPFSAVSPDQYQMVEGYDEYNAMIEDLKKSTEYWNERNKDTLTADRMYLFAEGQEFAKTFNISDGLLHRNADGQLQLGTFDISYNGRKLAHSIGDGTLALYRPDGTLAVDRYA